MKRAGWLGLLLLAGCRTPAPRAGRAPAAAPIRIAAPPPLAEGVLEPVRHELTAPVAGRIQWKVPVGATVKAGQVLGSILPIVAPPTTPGGAFGSAGGGPTFPIVPLPPMSVSPELGTPEPATTSPDPRLAERVEELTKRRASLVSRQTEETTSAKSELEAAESARGEAAEALRKAESQEEGFSTGNSVASAKLALNAATTRADAAKATLANLPERQARERSALDSAVARARRAITEHPPAARSAPPPVLPPVPSGDFPSRVPLQCSLPAPTGRIHGMPRPGSVAPVAIRATVAGKLTVRAEGTVVSKGRIGVIEENATILRLPRNAPVQLGSRVARNDGVEGRVAAKSGAAWIVRFPGVGAGARANIRELH